MRYRIECFVHFDLNYYFPFSVVHQRFSDVCSQRRSKPGNSVHSPSSLTSSVNFHSIFHPTLEHICLKKALANGFPKFTPLKLFRK